METASRVDLFFRICVLPTLMGLGHLVPTIGAIYTATGTYQFSPALLGMIGTAATLVDSYDTYKDTPLSHRPRKWLWRAWIYSMWAVVLITTYYVGVETAIRMYRFSLIGLGWGTPSIPLFSPSTGRHHLFKPKVLFVEAKSLVVAVCMGYVTADVSTFYYCHTQDSRICPTDEALRTRSLGLVILYQFFRETVCDTRDIAEDAEAKMRTLPVRLGKTKTLLLLAGVGILFDSFLTARTSLFSEGLPYGLGLQIPAATSILRVGMTVALYAVVLKYPKGYSVPWVATSLLGLVPVLWAQAELAG